MQLVSVKDGVTLWAAKFDEKLTDILRSGLYCGPGCSFPGYPVERRRTTANQEELHAQPRSISTLHQGTLLLESANNRWFAKGARLRTTSHRRRSTYAPAYVGLADSYNLLGAQHNVLPPKESFPKARAAAGRALEIDPLLAEAYASLGFINCGFEWDWPSAEQCYLRAIELKPNYPTAHHWYGEWLATMGRFEQAYVELQTAQELDPLSLAINVDLAASFYYSRQFDNSECQLLNLLELNSKFVRALVVLGKVYVQKSEFDKGIEVLQQAVEFSGDDPATKSTLAHALACAGKSQEARTLLDDLLKASAHRYISACRVAEIHTGMGDTEAAYAWLDQALENRDIELIWLKVNPAFDRLRAETRFIELMRAVNPGLVG